MFDFVDKICFTKAVYYSMKQIPLPKPFKDGTGGLGDFVPESGFLDLYDDEGCCAHHLAIDRGFVRSMLPKLLNGRKKSYNEWRHDLYWQIRNAGFQSGQAVDVGQVDLMMLDLLAQRYGKSLHRFMGAGKDWAVCYKGGGSLLLTDEELVDDMVRYVSEGYKTVKFKVGSGNGQDMERDIRRLAKVREAVGDEIGVAVDANQAFTVEEAVKFAEMAGPYHLEWFEEPIHAHDMNGIKSLKELGMKPPIAYGESMRISYAYETYLEKGVDHLQPSVGRMTRMDDLLAIRDMCRAEGKTFSSGGRLYLNLIFGCLYNEYERIEYHEPINDPIGEYTLFQPIKKGDRFYWEGNIIGNPLRMDIQKLERDGLLLSREIYLPNN